MKKVVLSCKRKLENGIYFMIVILSILLIVIPLLFLLKTSEGVPSKVLEEKNYNYYYNVNHKMNIGSFYFDDLNNSIAVNNIVNNDLLKDFYEVIENLVYEKYPNFVVEELVRDNTTKNYVFKEDYLEIMFTDHIYEENIENNIIIDYLYINDYLLETKEESKVGLIKGGELDKNKKIVALTFDDGPLAGNTEKIVDLLDENKSSATFFMLGLSMENNSKTIKYVYDHGHEIALHGYSHKNFTRIGPGETQKELDRTNQLLFDATGEYSNLVRPPYGNVNNNISNNLDYAYVMWNVDTDDWRYKDPDSLVKHVLDNVKDGDIILFHDIFETTTLAIEKLLPELYLKGYEVVDVSTLAEIKKINLEDNQIYYKFN